MEITAKIGKNQYRVNVAHAQDISIPVSFGDAQVAAFGVPPATKEPYKTDGFVGDVKHGGSCNCDMFHFSPHLHGTHTEGVGHITRAALAVHECLKDSLIPATLISVTPQEGKADGDSYIPAIRPTDRVITKNQILNALQGSNGDFLEALIIRTLPNDPTKRTERYQSAPYFSSEAMRYLVSYGIQHLVVDLPSIDRLDDEGKLSNHHQFWNVEPGSRATSAKSWPEKTVTELVYVPPEIKDGNYMLNLQVAAFAADAAPSRPLLYPVIAA